MEPHFLYPSIAFFVSLLFQAVYSKFIIEPNCPDKAPRPWLDHFILSLPIAISFTGVVYFFTSQWAPKRKNNVNGNTMMGNAPRGNNTGRMNGNAFGKNNGTSAAMNGGNGGNGAPMQGGAPPLA